MSFRENGHITIERLITGDAILEIEKTLAALYTMQASKCGEYRDKLNTGHPVEPRTRIEYILDLLEQNDKEALYQVQKLLASCDRIRSLLAQPLLERACDILGMPSITTLMDGPALFINRPKTKRLLYKWHSEAHYYPKRRNFVNVWIPIFTDRTEDNGAMRVKVGSHKRDFPFAEYDSGPHSFQQYEIPESFLTEYPEHVCTAKRGDVVFFDRQLVHRSAENWTTEYGFALVCRIWNPTDDLTLSGKMEATPYGNDIGRSNLRVAA